MSFEDQVRLALKSQAECEHTDTQAVKHSIATQISWGRLGRRSSGRLLRRMAPIVATVCALFMLYTGVSFASGHNPFAPIISFVHDIGSNDVTYTKIGFEGGLTDATDTEILESQSFNTYDTELDQYIGLTAYPKLNLGQAKIDLILVNMKNKEKQLFHMSTHIGGYTEGEGKILTLDAYHNESRKLLIEGQTSDDVQHEVDLSGTEATYIKFNNANNGRSNSYLTWRQGNWTLLLTSGDYSEEELTGIAKQINSQVK